MAPGGSFVVAVQVAWRFYDAGAEEVFLLAGDAVSHVLDAFSQPARCEGAVAKIVGAVAVDASYLLELVVLAELGLAFL